MPHLDDNKIKFLEDKKGQEFQDEIFRKMSADMKVKIGSDFSMYCLKRGLPDGTDIPMAYLMRWLKKNAIVNAVL